MPRCIWFFNSIYLELEKILDEMSRASKSELIGHQNMLNLCQIAVVEAVDDVYLSIYLSLEEGRQEFIAIGGELLSI